MDSASKLIQSSQCQFASLHSGDSNVHINNLKLQTLSPDSFVQPCLEVADGVFELVSQHVEVFPPSME